MSYEVKRCCSIRSQSKGELTKCCCTICSQSKWNSGLDKFSCCHVDLQQILMLEATILLGGIGLHDRYRDMRIDIDNMSYEVSDMHAFDDTIHASNWFQFRGLTCCD